MQATQKLHEMGQSLWLDNITRGLLTSGTLRNYIQEFSVTGLTSNPTIFDHAITCDFENCSAARRRRFSLVLERADVSLLPEPLYANPGCRCGGNRGPAESR
jgi:transaldolase